MIAPDIQGALQLRDFDLDSFDAQALPAPQVCPKPLAASFIGLDRQYLAQQAVHFG